MEKKYIYQDLSGNLLTKEQKDQMFSELDKLQAQRMKEFAEMLENDPRMSALCDSVSGHEPHKFDMSALEGRVSHLPQHVLFAPKGRDPESQLSPTLRRSGTVRGVVHRYPRMSDNLPKGEIKIDGSKMRNIQMDTHMGDTKTSNLSEAFLQTLSAEYGLTPEQLGEEGRIVGIDEAPYILYPKGCQTGSVGPSGRALRIDPSKGLGRIEGCSVWSAECRDRAATPASVRKKLRTKTRAQKKARRKQR